MHREHDQVEWAEMSMQMDDLLIRENNQFGWAAPESFMRICRFKQT